MENRIKELDGLRGVAILLVMSLHLVKRATYFTENPILKSVLNFTNIGWIGVDIFFTLSGFLITTILLSSKNKEGYFKNFYSRRMLRIFPLYYLAIGVVLLFAPRLEIEFIQNLKYALPIMLVYLQNWALLSEGFFITSYLGVTWSLAIEEQFYFIWPLIIRWVSKEKLIKFSIGYIVLSWGIRIATALLWEDLAEITRFHYYASFARFEEMLLGGLLAILLTYDGAKEKIRQFSLPMFILFSCFFIILCFLSLPNTPQPAHSNIPLTLGGYTAVMFFTTGLLGIFVTFPPESGLRRLFQNQILIFFGKYSYAMYLFHMIVGIIFLDVFWQRGFRGWEYFFIYLIASFGGTIILSLLSWHLLEKHMLNLKKYFEYKNSPESTR
jgi:peptidoglycan/LPS O-acetylase OafA/YrhL